MNSRTSQSDYSNLDVESAFAVTCGAVERVREARMAATPPDSNTGGNLHPVCQVATVDTLTWTLPIPALSDDPLVTVMMDDDAIRQSVVAAFLEPLGFALGLPTGRRLNGYGDSAPIIALTVDADSNGSANFGYCAWGGNRNKLGQDTLCVYLTGQGCEHVNILDADRGGRVWTGLSRDLARHTAKLTRLDVCYDDLDGDLGGVDAMVEWYQDGEFKGAKGGAQPSVCQHGDWIHMHSRTLEVGRRENGKLIRGYEKGHQLGQHDSPWTRYELELRSRDRVIPYDALTDPTGVLVGSCPAMERIASVKPRPIRTVTRSRLRVTMSHLQHYATVAYGRLINAMQGVGMSAEDIVSTLRVDGLPSRLYVPPALVALPDGA